MKKIIQISALLFGIALFSTACNNDNGSSIPKGDPAIVHTGDSSSAPSSGAATGTTNNSNPPSPAAAAPDSGGSKSGKDSSTMKKP